MKSESSISDGVFHIVSHVTRVFKRNETHRSTSGSTNVLTSALEAWARKPPQEDLNLFRSMGVLPNTYDSLTRTKLIQIMAVLNRVFAQVGDKSWGLISSPSPTLPEEVDAGIVAKYANEGLKVAEGIGASTVEEIVAVVADTLKMNEDQIESDRQKFASDRAQRMEKVVDDILFEAGFTINIMRQFIENLTKFGTAVIIGPYEVSTLVSKLRGSGDSVKYRPEIEKQLRFFVPSTLDVYPSPGTINVDDGDLCVVVRYSRQELTRAAKTASKNNKGGWRRDAINTLLENKPAGCTLETLDIADPVIRAATLGEVVGTTVRYEGVRWFGMMKGSDLRSVGVSTDGIAEIIGDNYYDAEMIVVAGQLVYANVADPAIGRPLVKTTFYCDSLQFFGWPVATQIDNCQKLMNLVMASLKKQLQLSGLVPLMINDYSSFADADKPGAFALTPGKVFLRNNNSFSQPGGQRPPVEPLVLPTIIRECIALFESIGKLADDASGFNRNMLGSGNFAGAARTATGLMQIQEAASIIASYVIGNIDAMAVVPILNKVVSWINYHHPDQSVKGDPQIIARGQLSKVMKSAESQVVAAGFNATQTGVMPQLLGPEKMLIALREYLKSIDFPNVDQIIPDEKRIQFLAQMEDVERSLGMLDKASAQQDPGQGGAPPQGGAVSGAAMGQEQPKRPYTRSVETDAGLKPQGNVEARRGVA